MTEVRVVGRVYLSTGKPLVEVGQRCCYQANRR